MPAADNVVFEGVSHDGRFAELAINSSTLVSQSLTLDWQTGKLTAWRAPNTPEIDPRGFAKASLESYPARDGTPIPMLVWRPAACDGPCPVVVEFHGGPESQARPGFSTKAAMSYFAGAYDAGAEQVGISNLSSFLLNTSPYRRILRISEYGDPVKDKEALTQLSPITHIAKVNAPMLIFQGVNDPRVPVGESVQIYKQLAQRKVPARLILFPDEGHGSVKRGNIVLTLGHTIAFFEEHLMGKVASKDLSKRP